MKLKIYGPDLYVLAFIFLSTIPYLYPNNFFYFKKVFSYEAVALTALALAIIALISKKIAESIKIKTSSPASRIKNNTLYRLSKTIILISLFVNISIVINAITNHSGDVLITKQTLRDFGGLNIISQIYIPFIPIFIITANELRKKFKIILVLMAIFLLARSYLLAERLAFIEFIIPVIISLSIINKTRASLLNIILIFSSAIIFFITFEITRQFYNQYVKETGTFDIFLGVTWSLERFFSYYADTLNKFYFLINFNTAHDSFNIIKPIFTILSRLGFNFEQSSAIYYSYYNFKDFTNPGGLAQIYADFGFFFGSLFLIFIIFLLYYSYRKTMAGSYFMLGLYSMLILCILEIPRLFLFYETRLFIPLLFYSIVFMSIKITKNIK